jgi:hypothetical protein
MSEWYVISRAPVLESGKAISETMRYFASESLAKESARQLHHDGKFIEAGQREQKHKITRETIVAWFAAE